MNKNEKIDMLEAAQEHIQEAIELIEVAIEGTADASNTKAYLLDRLKIIVGEGHEFLCSDLNIDQVIKKISKC